MKKIILTEINLGWSVALEDGELIYPTIDYPTKRLAIARILQLLDLGPVAPQTHPESVCIGEDILASVAEAEQTLLEHVEDEHHDG
jgi:hypothetical protein